MSGSSYLSVKYGVNEEHVCVWESEVDDLSVRSVYCSATLCILSSDYHALEELHS